MALSWCFRLTVFFGGGAGALALRQGFFFGVLLLLGFGSEALGHPARAPRTALLVQVLVAVSRQLASNAMRIGAARARAMLSRSERCCCSPVQCSVQSSSQQQVAAACVVIDRCRRPAAASNQYASPVRTVLHAASTASQLSLLGGAGSRRRRRRAPPAGAVTTTPTKRPV